jgi:hypothetical protein
MLQYLFECSLYDHIPIGFQRIGSYGDLSIHTAPLIQLMLLHQQPYFMEGPKLQRRYYDGACARLSGSYLPRSYVATFPKRSQPWLFTNAALGGLKPAPASRLRGVCPHLLCSYAHFLEQVRSWRTKLRSSWLRES